MSALLSKWRYHLIVIMAGVICMGGYLITSVVTHGPGFPLDDAWIHQTYARNLVLYHQWTYFPGNTTNGSTAPLWTLLLSIGYVIKVPYLVWAYVLGGLSLCGLGVVGYELGKKLFNNNLKMALILALLLVSEWHLVWASVSGMETILLAFLVVLITFCLSLDRINWVWVGGLLGLAIWIRPDAVSLSGPAFLILWMNKKQVSEKFRDGLGLIIAISVLLTLYLYFNKSLSGSWMPNTFYAKQAEYQVLLNQPWLIRFGQLVLQPMIGVGILFVPGFIYQLCSSVKTHSWLLLAMALWWLGYTAIYATFLPVSYQHGRYEIPAMPVYFILGFCGTSKLIGSNWRRRKWSVLLRTWAASIFTIGVVFNLMGAWVYCEDVGIIQSEMVNTAIWISKNTPQQTLVAAHDIGALGYWGNRKIIDLAGLVTTDVIPFIREEQRLAEYLDQQGADYLVSFPGWYPEMVKNKPIIYQSQDKLSIEAGGENMAVYFWRETK